MILPSLGKEFVFDGVLGENAKQSSVFESCMTPLLDALFEGYNCSVIAYGQTGSGKTHTMMGPAMFSGERDKEGRTA